jgi:MFS family permease
MILLIAGWSLLLLPFSLATSVASKWASASIISMIVVGFCSLIAFMIWERFFATKTFLPFHLLKDRTVIGSCLTAATLFISFYTWDYYLNSYLQVVFNLSIADSGYVYNIYSIGSCFWGLVVGILIPISNRYKWLAMCAVPLMILGTGLMIYFRQPDHNIGYVIMCQIFIAFAGGTLVITQEVAIMAVVGPANIAVALALQSLFTAIGGAIGSTISGAIWTNIVPAELVKNLPPDLKGQAMDIYADLTVQLGYPIGSPGRDGIIAAYAVAQRYMCIAGTAVLALMIVWVMMWRDIDVRTFKKPPGAKIV